MKWKMEKANLGFCIYKIWQILKHLGGSFLQAPTTPIHKIFTKKNFFLMSMNIKQCLQSTVGLQNQPTTIIILSTYLQRTFELPFSPPLAMMILKRSWLGLTCSLWKFPNNSFSELSVNPKVNKDKYPLFISFFENRQQRQHKIAPWTKMRPKVQI